MYPSLMDSFVGVLIDCMPPPEVIRVEKWNLPKGPPPRFLDAADERTAKDDHPKLARPQFVVAVMDAARACGCDPRQAAGVTANAINEAAGGRAEYHYNAGGWKMTKAYAEAYRKAHGKGPPWWEAPGNKAAGATPEDLKGGDPPWCQYRVFGSRAEYIAAWIGHFVPRPGGPMPYLAYKRTGALFWAGDPGWFEAMCRAGYKGRITQKNPAPSVQEHESLVRESLTRWVQAKLGVVPDNRFGPMSRAAAEAFQTAHGLPVTGAPDDDLIAALAKV